MTLRVTDLTAGPDRQPAVVHGLSFEAKSGRITALIGPNGAGKTTALKAMLGLVPARGGVSWDGFDLGTASDLERARRLAYVPQRSRLTAPLAVRHVVALGRFAHVGPLHRLAPADEAAVTRALHRTGLEALADRPFPALSGGEQQRVLLARALASDAPCLLLDEPTASLDVRHVLQLHRLLRATADEGRAVVVVLHDLSEVADHADDAVLIHEGRRLAAGPARDVVTGAATREAYGVTLVPGGAFGYRLETPGGAP